MKVRYVRPNDRLQDAEEIVVRGGDLDREILREDAERTFSIYGVYGVSVFALRGLTIDELSSRHWCGFIC